MSATIGRFTWRLRMLAVCVRLVPGVGIEAAFGGRAHSASCPLRLPAAGGFARTAGLVPGVGIEPTYPLRDGGF